MKNIHLIPTDKPNRLYSFYGMLEDLSYGKTFTIVNEEIAKINLHKDLKEYQENLTKAGWKSENIYITSEEKIKKRDWYFNPKTNKVNKVGHYGHYGYSSKKIILTTDPDLIKDGVQAIDDEFLEWFVNNPSCEYVEVEEVKCKGQCWKFIESDYEDTCTSGCEQIEYKIIIPKEKPCTQNVVDEAMRIVSKDVRQPKCVRDGLVTEQKQETLEDKIQMLISEWQQRQDNYEDIAQTAKDEHTDSKFTYKAVATRDCWKELLKVIEQFKK